jgi:hypothetical protein
MTSRAIIRSRWFVGGRKGGFLPVDLPQGGALECARET